VQTGLRVSELLGLTLADVQLGADAHVRATGKGRKQRVAPLTRQTVAVLRVWTRENAGQPADPLFASRHGGPLTATRSNAAWPSTSPARSAQVPRFAPSASRCTSCATPAR
jgi:integrase